MSQAAVGAGKAHGNQAYSLSAEAIAFKGERAPMVTGGS